MAQTRPEEDFSKESQSASEDTGRESSHADHPLTYVDMSSFAADINSTFLSSITDLRTNLLVLTEKLALAEAAGKHRDKAIHRLEKVSISYSHHFI